MAKIPTAEKYLQGSETYDKDYPTISLYDAEQRMIEFAKLHVAAALKEASGKLYDTYHTVCEDGTTKGVFRTQQEALNLANHLNETTDLYHDWNRVVRLGGGMSKDTILNSYPLDNIK